MSEMDVGPVCTMSMSSRLKGQFLRVGWNAETEEVMLIILDETEVAMAYLGLGLECFTSHVDKSIELLEKLADSALVEAAKESSQKLKEGRANGY
jgi:hypothetical protein